MKAPADTLPYWFDSAAAPTFPKLDRNLDVDVVIVGGGITGLTAAYLLTAQGREVALIERERLAGIDTGHTSAHLTMVTDQRFTDLEKSFGRERAQAVWDAGLAAMAQIVDIVHAEAIDCDLTFVPGYMHAPLGAAPGEGAEAFRTEAETIAAAGFDAAFTDDVPLVGGPGVTFADQARFHPRKYLGAVARVVSDRGGLLFEHTAADEFSESPLSVKANGFTIRCRDVIVATHTPLLGNNSMLRATTFQTKLALYTSYVIAGRVEPGRVPDALLWDTGDPYHYFRLDRRSDGDIVIFGGEDHKTGQVRDTNERYRCLERALASVVGNVDISHRWSGQVIETADGLPYIGEMAPHQFAGTGYSGNGMTFGTLAGMMGAARVLGRRSPWGDLFDPGRVKLTGAAWDYVRENKDYPYYLIRDRIARMTGAKKTGPVCTHMGCLTAWNDAEKTWDCPCHGSRFKPNGDVIAGPAETPIERGS
jgi:glycine/D-amino acid oxidase-like deaminating enzyme